MKITNLRYHDEGEKIKLTWSWEPEMKFFYVNENLFTLDEYKKRGGYFTKKVAGDTIYSVVPFCREDGKDILFEKISLTVRVNVRINLAIRELIGRYKNHEVTINSEYDIPPEIICYRKNETTYYFGEPVTAHTPVTRIIRTEKNESINFFINEEFSNYYLFA